MSQSMAPPDSRRGRSSRSNPSHSGTPPPESNGRSASAVRANVRGRPIKEENDEGGEDQPSHSPRQPSRARNGREKTKNSPEGSTTGLPDDGGDQPMDEDEQEDQGITRCVCGSTEDDPDAGDFMAQCEGCKAWQHGLCMGFRAEDQLPDDYQCERCKPENYPDLLKKMAKRVRHSSVQSHAASRLSRSHSPSVPMKPAKRRNTMNSRLDDQLKEALEATAIEAGVGDTSMTSNGSISGRVEADEEPEPRKKRKRTEDDVTPPKKRTRSASSVSDPAPPPQEDSPPPSKAPAPVPKPGPGRKKGGRKPAAPVPDVEGEEISSAPPPTISAKRGGNGRGRGGHRRPPISHAQVAGSSTHEHGTRRNPTGINGSTSGQTSESRAYRGTHAYAVAQQSLHSSWNLPDYLAHLHTILPTETPNPLEVRGSGLDSIERSAERGVKVKWPSKRMSVTDMNKRVRSMVEWVGREQGSGMDRGRRKVALDAALKDRLAEDDTAMLDGEASGPFGSVDEGESNWNDSEFRGETTKMMDKLMEELIAFQEKFGNGGKRERRTATSVS